MSFPSGITSQQYSDIRADGYKGTLHVLKTPQNIVFQAPVANDVEGADYAQIVFGTPTTGAYTDIKDGMTVLVHSDSADIDSVVFPATYSRKTATSSIIYIGWQATNLLDTYTITVLDDYALHLRQVRAEESAIYIDYDKTFVPIPPAISGLQSVYAKNTSSAWAVAFAPTVVAMASGSAISSYLWDVGDGTITIGTSASKDITVSFPTYSSGATSGWRQVSFTATDDNAQTTTIHFQVFVGDFSSAEWVIDDVFSVNAGHNRDEGSIASLTIGASASTFYLNNHITIVAEESKLVSNVATALTPVVNNIVFVGRAKNLIDEDIAEFIDAQLGLIGITQNTTYELQGYQAEMALLPLPAYQLLNVPSATAWNEVSDCSIDRAIWYILTRLTTAPNYICFDLNSSVLSTYENVGFSFESGNVLDSIQDVADLQGQAFTFARDGQARLRKDARLEASADRGALDTVAGFTSDDLLRVSFNEPPQSRIGKAEATAGSLNTTSNKVTLLRAQAPMIPNTTGEAVRVTDYLLDRNQSQADMITELSTLIANFLALKNDVRNISIDMLDGYWFLIADNNVWTTITYSNLTSGRAYTSSIRWVISDVVLSMTVVDIGNGIYRQEWDVSLNLLFETIDEGTANSFAFAPEVMPYDIPDNTILFPFGSNGNPANDYGDGETGLGDDKGDDFYQPVDPPYEDTPKAGTETLLVPLFNSGGVDMVNATESGETYSVIVTGWTGRLGAAASTVSLLNGNGQGASVAGIAGINGGWTLPLDGPQEAAGSYSAGNDRYEAEVQSSPNTAGSYSGGAIRVTVANPTNISSIVVTFESNTNSGGSSTLISMYDSNVGFGIPLAKSTSGGDGSLIYNGALTTGATLDIIYRGVNTDPTISYCYVTSITINYGEGDDAYDAFYSIDSDGQGTVLESDEGLHLNATKVTTPSGYNAPNKYEFSFVGTGVPETFNFLLDSYTGVPYEFLNLEISGAGL